MTSWRSSELLIFMLLLQVMDIWKISWKSRRRFWYYTYKIDGCNWQYTQKR